MQMATSDFQPDEWRHFIPFDVQMFILCMLKYKFILISTINVEGKLISYPRHYYKNAYLTYIQNALEEIKQI